MALAFVGVSNLINTNGTAPGAITPHANTQTGDFLLFFHYSAITGGDETITIPAGFTSIATGTSYRSTNNGLMAVGYRFRQSGDTTFTASVTNHATGTSGETIIEWISTWRGVDTTTPVGDVTALLTAAATTTNFGPFSASTITSVPSRSMMYLFAGRHDDLATVAQDTLSGDSLTWTARTVDESTNGADAATFTQTGLNETASAIDPSGSYTITGHGASTSATGTGLFFVINAAPEPAVGVDYSAQLIRGRRIKRSLTRNWRLMRSRSRFVIPDGGRVTTTWASSYVVRDRATTTWQSSYVTRDRATSTWQSSYVVRDRVTTTWQSSYGIAGHAVTTWTSSYTIGVGLIPRGKRLIGRGRPKWIARARPRTPAAFSYGTLAGTHVTTTWTSSYTVPSSAPAEGAEASHRLIRRPKFDPRRLRARRGLLGRRRVTAPAPTHVTTTWQSSYTVRDRATTTWASSYTVRDRVTTTWQSQYAVGGRQLRTWASSYVVRDRASTTWQSSYVVRDRAATTWASSDTVRDRVTTTWQSSYAVEVTGLDHVTTTWQSSYVVNDHATTTWASSYVVRDRLTVSWPTSYTVRLRLSTTWQTSYVVKDRSTTTWTSSYRIIGHEGAAWTSSYSVFAGTITDVPLIDSTDGIAASVDSQSGMAGPIESRDQLVGAVE